jgi:hypothetical protein
MGNPINWGGTPLENSAVRGIIAVVLFGILKSLFNVQQGGTIEDAAVEGFIWAIPAFLAMLGFGFTDQDRANKGVVITSDVPAQLEAKIGTPTDTVLADRAGARPRKPSIVAQEMTERFKKALHRH